MNLTDINEQLREGTPAEIIQWALQVAKRPVVTTNFRPYESAILHAVTQASPTIPVIWCDTGYNTPATYRHAEELIAQLSMNVHCFVPQQTVAHRNVVLGIPAIDTPAHQLFTQQVKLEPFQRAMETFQPDVWFTNLRKDQTVFRSELDIVTRGKDGMLKVCPFYYWTDPQLDDYLTQHDLTTETNYYDPTKALENRECGLHTH